MRRTLMLVVLFLITSVPTAYGHLSNEITLYHDSAYMNAQAEVLYLQGIGAISSHYEDGSRLYRPQDKLSRLDLAFWAARFAGLADPSISKEQAAQAALRQGLVNSLEGDATYGDVNQAYFGGQAPATNPANELTREEFALYMGRLLTEKVDGRSLMERGGLEPGPSGIITKVSHEMGGDGGTLFKVYTVVIGGRTYKVEDHGRLLHGPVELAVWEGKELAESWISAGSDGEPRLAILAAKEGQFSVEEMASSDDLDHHAGHEHGEAQGVPVMLLAGILIMASMVLWVLVKRKR